MSETVTNFTLDFITRNKVEFNEALIKITNTGSDLLSILRCLDEELYEEVADKEHRKMVTTQIKELYFIILQPLYWRTTDENHTNTVREIMTLNNGPYATHNQLSGALDAKQEKVLAETWVRFNKLIHRCIGMEITTEQIKTLYRIYDSYTEEAFYEFSDDDILDYLETHPLK